MAENNFKLDLIARLKKTESQKQVKRDIQSYLSNIKIPLIGTLNSRTKAQLKKEISTLNGTEKLKPIEVTFAVKKEKLLNDIKLLAQQNSKLFKSSDLAEKYHSLLDNAELAGTADELGILRTQLSSLRSELQLTGNSGITMTKALKNGLSKILQLFENHGIIAQFMTQLRNAWAEAKELDASMTSLSKVCNELADKSSFPAYIDKSISKAKELCTDVNDLLYAVTEFKKLGNTLKNSEILAEYAVRLHTVGDTNMNAAISSITTAMNSFDEIGGYTDRDYEKKAEAYIDLINNLSNQFSVDAESLANAVQISAGTLAEANTGIEETAAMIAAVSQYSEDPASLANTLNIGALRLRASKTSDEARELTELGENIDDLAESTSELRNDMMALTGVDIMMDDRNFKPYYQQLLEISEVYQTLDESAQANVLEKMFGKDRSAAGEDILRAMPDSVEIYKEALLSAGTSAEEFLRWTDSSEAAAKRLGVAMTETYNNIIGGHTVTGLENAGAAVLEFANSWGIVEGTLKGFMTLGVLKGVTVLTTAFKNSAVQISNYGEALKAVQILNTFSQDTEKYADAMTVLQTSCASLTDTQLKQVLSNKGLAESQLIEILQIGALEEKERTAKLAQLGLIQTTEMQTASQGKAAVSTFSLSAAMKGLGASIKAAWISNPIGVIITGVSAAVGLVTMGISKLKQKQEETRQAMQEAKQEYQDLASELDSLNEELKATRERLEELDAVGYHNLSLVEQEEYDRLKSTNKELEREYRIKEALAKIKAKEVADNALKILDSKSEGTIDNYVYGAGRKKLDQIDSLNEYLNLAEQQKQNLEEIQQELKDYEANYAGTAEDMVQDKSWLELKDNVEKAENALSDTEKSISKKYEKIETESEGLVDSFGNVVSGCEEMYRRVEEAKNRVDQYFNPQAETPDKLGSMLGSALEEPEVKKQTLFEHLTQGKESLDQFQSSIKSAADAYTLLLSGSYSSTELLNSIQTINQAVTDMGGSLNWEFINGQTNSIELLGDAIEYISQKYAESVLSDMGIDTGSGLGQMLTDMVRQMYETEAAFTGMNEQIDSLQSSYQTLTGIIESYNETGYISFDNLQSILTADENLIAMLEVENGQLAINQTAYENLAAAQLLEFKCKLNAAAAAEIEALAKARSLVATNNNAAASNDAISKLDTETNAINRNTIAAASNALAKAKEAGVSDEEIQSILDKYNEIWNAAVNNFKGDFSGFMGGGISAAGKAGGQAADAYLEAFQKEYDHLKDLSDRGEISESQHLTALRALYTRYFKDRKEYLDEYKKYESEYLSGMFDLHNKALSGISTLLNQKINAANDAKDSAISALEEEKEAAAEAYQTQIDALEEEKNAIDDLIKEKEKKIDALNEEADAIQKAADTRKKNIDLQKAEYQLERMLNQRTTAVYRENEGFVFEADTSGIRDAREDVRDAEEGLEINRLQNKADLIRKEINLLEEKKDALTEEQEAIQKMLDESNKYYDNMIKQQEKMWDSMIRNMEQQKSRWEELADIEQIADAYSKVQQVFGEMGYTVEEVLNGNGQAFEDFKSRYISILSDINQNAPFLDGLAYASGVAREQFGSIVSDAQNTVQQLSQTFSDGTFSDAISKGVSDGIVSAQQELNNMNQLGNDAGEGFIEGWKEKSTEISDVTKQTAADAVEAFAEGQDSNSPSEKYKVLAGDAIDGLLLGMEEKKQLFIDSIRSMSEEGVLAFENGFTFDDSTIKTSFDSLILLIQSVSEALGFGTEDSVGGLLGALNQLSAFSFEENAEGVIAQFEGLRAAIDGVVSAISGGGGESAEGKSLYGKSVSISKRKQTGGNGSEGGGNSITGAFTAMGETAREVIGEPNAEGDGTVIGEFGALETAVTDVADAIGSDQESDPKLSKSNEDSVSLTDSIISLGETTEETLGKSGGDGVIGRFEKFKNVIGEANEHVTGIYTGLKDIDGQTAECTIKVTIETTGDGLWNAAGASMNLGSAQYNAQYLGTACVEGTALASGNWAVQSDEKRALLGELGYEIIVRNGRFFTVGNSGPEMFHIKRGDIVFNHKQSVELLKNGHTSGRGKAYADGTVGGGKILTKEGHILSPVPDDHPMMQMRKKFDAFLQKMGGMEVLSVNAMAEHNRKMGEIMKQINISNIVNHNRNIHPVIHQNITLNCPNVTNDSGVEYIQRQLAHLSQRAYQEPLMNY